MNSKIVKTHEQLLNTLITKLSKARDTGDNATARKTESDIAVTAATLEMWQAALHND